MNRASETKPTSLINIFHERDESQFTYWVNRPKWTLLCQHLETPCNSNVKSWVGPGWGRGARACNSRDEKSISVFVSFFLFVLSSAFIWYFSAVFISEMFSINTCSFIEIPSNFLTFTYRSIVLLSTRGEIKRLNISDSLVPLGLAKPAHLYNKGLYLYCSLTFLWVQPQKHFLWWNIAPSPSSWAYFAGVGIIKIIFK